MAAIPQTETYADKSSVVSLYLNVPSLIPPHPYCGITFWTQNVQVHPAWFIYLGMTAIKFDSVDWFTLDNCTSGQVRRALWDAINIASRRIELDEHIRSRATLAYEDVVFFMTMIKVNNKVPLDTLVYNDFPHIITNRWMLVNMAGYAQVVRPQPLLAQPASPVISSTTSASLARSGTKRSSHDPRVSQEHDASH